MSEANDISRLFSRFGGHPDEYHEIGRDNLARSSEARWPLLASVARQATTMQAARDVGHASLSLDTPECTVSAITSARTAGDSLEPRPSVPSGSVRHAGHSVVAPHDPSRASVAPEGTVPLAQFIPPRRRMSPPPVAASRESVQPPAMLAQRQAQARPEARTADEAWQADVALSHPVAALSGHQRADRAAPRAQQQTPLQAMFARLEIAAESQPTGAHIDREVPAARTSIFERLARR